MFTYKAESALFRWEMSGQNQLRQIHDDFALAIKPHQYRLHGYLAMRDKLYSKGHIGANLFYLTCFKRDLKRKGITLRDDVDRETFQQKTHGIFMSYLYDACDCISEYYDAACMVPFFAINESELDVLEEKYTTLMELNTRYLVHADILLDSETYDFLLFHAKPTSTEKVYFGEKLGQWVFDALHHDSPFTYSVDELMQANVQDFVSLNCRKLALDARVNIKQVQQQCQHYHACLEAWEAYFNPLDNVGEAIQQTLTSEHLPLSDKIRILMMTAQDLVKNLNEHLVMVKQLVRQFQQYQLILLLIAQVKLIIAIKTLAHNYYCNRLAQLGRLELVKAIFIKHHIRL